MSDETIVAIYDTPAHAELAAADLRQAGVPESAISIHSGAAGMAGMDNGATATGSREQGFWTSLFGGAPDHDTAVYDRSVQSGSSVLSVKTPEAHVDRVVQILESHNPIDIDDRAATYAQTTGLAAASTTVGSSTAHTSASNTGMTTGTPTGTNTGASLSGQTAPMARSSDEVAQLAEERLSVGKRVVNHGGTRIRRFVVERPVEENVTLHTERVVLDRHPVTDGRPATDSFTDKTIEMTETSEEAVVSKTAHVYEEVGLRKEVSDRVETVKDTVRKEEVEIEQIPGKTAAATQAGSTTSPTRKI